MDLTNQDTGAETQNPADVKRCPNCQLTARVAVALTTATVLVGLLLCVILFEGDEASTSSSTEQRSMTEQLQRCQAERHDLSLMLHSATQDSRCRLCPDGWLWWRSCCYFFSVGLQENRRWNESAEFCQEHNSSLAVIRDSTEMEFIQSVMRKFPQFPFLWVGLTDTEQEGRWLWWDGTDVQHYMPLTVEWDADHRDCADLRGGASLFAADCDAYGPWACKRDS